MMIFFYFKLDLKFKKVRSEICKKFIDLQVIRGEIIFCLGIDSHFFILNKCLPNICHILFIYILKII